MSLSARHQELTSLLARAESAVSLEDIKMLLADLLRRYIADLEEDPPAVDYSEGTKAQPC